MTDAAHFDDLPAPQAAAGGTPAGLQPARVLTRRRALVAALNLVTLALVMAGAAKVFGAGGWTVTDIIIVACVALGAPWTVMGVWNALIGLWLLHGRKDGLAQAAPHMEAAASDAPILLSTAVVMTLRNEDPERALSRLAVIRGELDRTPWAGRFSFHVLSDTDDPAIAAAEEAAMRRLAPTLRAQYRRRAVNTGFKAGNIRDFLRREGRGSDLFLPLDSDSLMGAQTILSMVRVMQAHPRLGILQGLVVGAPSASAFARVFQFGMRAGMRSFTMGAAWWHGDCGPFWGHNALVRAAPFRTRCALPVLPGKPPLGGHILSHDQVEAALMRRAGWEVRVFPTEAESWEENPPTILDYTRRDLRWCQGNMQYLKLLGLKGLRPMSRFQVFAAVMMYFGAPAWMLMTCAAVAKILEGEAGSQVDLAFGVAMMLVMLAMSLVPKLAGWADVALTRGGVARYGGRLRFAAGALAETVFSMLLAPVVAFQVTLFLVGLFVFRRSVIWGGQQRDARALPLRVAAGGLWPQTLFGLALGAAVLWGAPGALVWSAPVLAGLVLAIPFAVLTASPALGAAMSRAGLCAIPDEYAPAPALAAAVGEAAPGTARAA
ncbi:glucans biosynthesis glucosyltransferase MdoH [Rhodovulum sp. DZ06]|uniref:glucans biosynthesis glucosyltransferase MdoH n=1 Tax=Rhodovulum sp. DZ06 TaxID=3425126 RepID=UPI003D33C947